jgi:hypothetical protein
MHDVICNWVHSFTNVIYIYILVGWLVTIIYLGFNYLRIKIHNLRGYLVLSQIKCVLVDSVGNDN